MAHKEARKDDKIEARVPAADKARYAEAANSEGVDLTQFTISALESRVREVEREFGRLTDTQMPILGFRYLVREGSRIKFKDSNAVAIAAIVHMHAARETPTDVAAYLGVSLAAVLEARYFCEAFPEEVERFYAGQH